MTAPDPRLDECATCLGCPDCGPTATKRTVEAITHRLGKVSEGPWTAWDRGIGYEIHNTYGEPINDRHRETFTKGDAEFIAMAPGDVHYLLAELRKAHEALERVEAITDEMDETAALRAVNADVKSYYGSRIRAAVAAAKGDERG